MTNKISISIELAQNADPEKIGQAIALLISQMENPTAAAEELEAKFREQLNALQNPKSEEE